jgi:hypothetical protein
MNFTYCLLRKGSKKKMAWFNTDSPIAGKVTKDGWKVGGDVVSIAKASQPAGLVSKQEEKPNVGPSEEVE